MRPRILFICGTRNQTTQMLAIAAKLPEFECAFTPYYGDAHVHLGRELGLIDWNIAGQKLGDRCFADLARAGVNVDRYGRSGRFDIAVTCSDLVMPSNIRGKKVVLVQEGILDPEGLAFAVVRRAKLLPRWLAGTAVTGLSHAYDRFCVASQGYADHFAERGIPREKLAVTGIPNFDDIASFKKLSFWDRDYALVCTSDTRETGKLFDSRERFIRRAIFLAEGRRVIWKLHPNEDADRETARIRRIDPSATVYAEGPVEAMVANAACVITQYSSLAFVALALGKKVHSVWPTERLRDLMPIQNRRAACEIAEEIRALAGLPVPERKMVCL